MTLFQLNPTKIFTETAKTPKPDKSGKMNRRVMKWLSFLPSKYNSSSLRYICSKSSASPSPLESNILGILCNKIQKLSDYALPRQPVTEFDRFMVIDRPGEQWITLRGKSSEDETIKIEATMFNGSTIDPKSDNEGTKEQDERLQISLLVDVWKGEGTEFMEFVCSAWPNSLEIQKVYIFKREEPLSQPYMCPNIRKLNPKLQNEFYEFLKKRGVNDGLCEFLHEYMMNKDKLEYINWLEKVKSYFEVR